MKARDEGGAAAPHLSPSACGALALSDPERIRVIRDGCWVNYPAAVDILARLEDLLEHPPTGRMPNALIVGESNSGKSAVLDRFVRRHPPHANRGGDAVVVPVVSVQAPPGPAEARLYDAVFDRLRCPYRAAEPVQRKQTRAIDLLRTVSCRVLVIDEFHNALGGAMTRRAQFLNAVKYLGNELQLPIVLAGTRDAFHLLQQDAQFQNRFRPVQLRRWPMDTEWRRLLLTFEGLLPLRLPSRLADPALARRLHTMSEGLLGELAGLLREAAVHAVRTGAERIGAGLLDELRWVGPADRKWQEPG